MNKADAIKDIRIAIDVKIQHQFRIIAAIKTIKSYPQNATNWSTESALLKTRMTWLNKTSGP